MSEIVYQAVIPLEPRSKKNSQKICVNRKTGRPFIQQSDIYKQFERDCGYFLRKIPEPIDYPVNCKYLMYRSTLRSFDSLNGCAAIDDILVKYKIIADDNFKIVVGHDGSRVRVDRNNPRIEIIITKETEL